MPPDRIRVLMLIGQFWPNGGGAEVFTVGLADRLPRDRFDARVCTIRDSSGFLLDTMRDAGVPYFSLGREGKIDVRPFARLRRYLREERIDVLHTHLFAPNAWGAVVGRLAGTPVIVAHEHTWSYEGQPLRKLIDGQVIGRLATTFVSVSSIDRERMIALERVKPDKVRVIPAAFVPREPTPPGGVREELGIPAGAPLVGTVISMRPQKALTVLLDALALLSQRIPDVHYVAVGNGPEKHGWEAYAASLGLSDRVRFTGPRHDVDRLIGAFDVSALSSDFEGTPLFVFESMAAGTPLVSTAVGGLPDVVDDGRTGLLVPPRDPAALADALESLLTDRDRAAAMSAAATERLPEFSIDAIARRTGDLYEQLLGDRR